MDAQNKSTNQMPYRSEGITRMQTFIESGDLKVHDIKVRSDELPRIFNKSDTAQDELEPGDGMDHSSDRQASERQYFEIKAKFNELLHSAVQSPVSRHSSPQNSLSTHSNTSPRSRHSNTHIKLPTIALPTLKVIHVVGYTTEIFLRH
jgi:hypothetical protein